MLRAHPRTETSARLPVTPTAQQGSGILPRATARTSALSAGPPARPALPAGCGAGAKCSSREAKKDRNSRHPTEGSEPGSRQPAGPLGLGVLEKPILSDLQSPFFGEILPLCMLTLRAGLAGAGTQPFRTARAVCGRKDSERLQPRLIASLDRARPARLRCAAPARPGSDVPGGSPDSVSCI